MPPRPVSLSRRAFLGLASAAGGIAIAAGHPGAAPRRHPADDWDALSAFERLHFPKVRLPVMTANGDRVPIAIEMGHGDLVVMGGSCQRTWEHAIPKTAKPVGPRISIQFRPAGVA